MINTMDTQLQAHSGDTLTLPAEARNVTIVVQMPMAYAEDDEIDLIDYLRVLKKRFWWIFFATLIPILAGMAFWLSIEPRFSATIAYVTPYDTGLWEDRIISVEVIEKLIEKTYPFYHHLRGYENISLFDYFQTKNTEEVLDRTAQIVKIDKASNNKTLGKRLGLLSIAATDSVFASAVANEWIEAVRNMTEHLRERDLELHKALVADLQTEMLRVIQDSLQISEKLARLTSGEGTSITLSQQFQETRLHRELIAQQLANTQQKLAGIQAEIKNAAMFPIQVVRAATSDTCTKTRGKPWKILLLPGAIGLMLGVFGAFAFEYIQKIKTQW